MAHVRLGLPTDWPRGKTSRWVGHIQARLVGHSAGGQVGWPTGDAYLVATVRRRSRD